ncbi:MAG: P-loop NTPase [Halanaeroarchaeum sp.]
MILTVCGGKGGVGKTTVSLALGHALDAVVVDADVTMADLPIDAGPTLQDVLAERVSIDAAIRDDWAVRVLPAGRSLASARSIDYRGLARTLRDIDHRGGPVVVDGPAGLGADAALPMTIADACVLVTTPATTAIADAVRTRALAREFDAGIGGVVLNRIRQKRPPIERRLGGPVIEVPASIEVSRATARGLPVTLTAPDTRAAANLEELADRLNRVTRRARYES